MADKTFKVNSGDEIVITVPRRAPTGGEITMRRAAALKAMIRSRRVDDSSARRIQPTGKIEFFDPAQFFDGANWITRPLYYATNVEFDPVSAEPPNQTGWSPNPQPPTDLEMKAFFDAVSTPEAISGARKVKKSNAGNYPILVVVYDNEEVVETFKNTDALENWTDDGLTLTAGQIGKDFAFTTFEITEGAKNPGGQFGFLSTLQNKITLENDYNADPVTNFTLSKGAKIYLAPVLVISYGQSIENVGGTLSRLVILNETCNLLPRRFEFPGSIYTTNTGEMEAFEIASSLPGSRRYTFDRYFALPYIRSGVSSGGTFNTADPSFLVQYAILNKNLASGSLAGIIRQNGKSYYFWHI